MEMLAFWTSCLLIWLYFRLTTFAQRRQVIRSGWLVLLLTGAVGFVWELAH